MKKRNILPALALLSILFFTTCTEEARRDLVDDYTEGVVLNINTDIFRIPASVQFTDANQSVEDPPAGLTVRVEGPDKDLVYSTDGKKDIQPIDGVMELAIDKAVEITPENPLEITVIAEAPGYLKTVQNVTLYDTSFQFLSVNMVNLNALPSGVGSRTATVNLGSEGIAQDTSFKTPLGALQQEDAEITMPAGTKMLDADGNELTGDVEIQMVHFDNRSPESLEAFPGGLEATNVMGPDGEMMDVVQFVTAGFLAVDMYVGKREVKTFTEPVELSVGINPGTIDPNTNEPVKAGDRIPMWSLNDDTGQWSYEGEARVIQDASGGLRAEMEITHLSWWNLDYFYGNICRSWRPLTLNIQSDYRSYREAPWAIVGLVDASTNRPFRYPRYMRLYDGQRINLYNLPANRQWKLRFYSSYSYYCREVVYETEAFTSTCNSIYDLDLRGIPSPSNITISAEVSAFCEGTGADAVIRPTAYIQYRPQGCSRWSYLDYVYRGWFYSNRLQRNEVYDFRAFYGGQTYVFKDIPIQTTTIEVEEYKLDINLDGDRAHLDFTDIEIPEEYCELLLGG